MASPAWFCIKGVGRAASTLVTVSATRRRYDGPKLWCPPYPPGMAVLSSDGKVLPWCCRSRCAAALTTSRALARCFRWRRCQLGSVPPAVMPLTAKPQEPRPPQARSQDASGSGGSKEFGRDSGSLGILRDRSARRSRAKTPKEGGRGARMRRLSRRGDTAGATRAKSRYRRMAARQQKSGATTRSL
jgi:hypothetical protein